MSCNTQILAVLKEISPDGLTCDELVARIHFPRQTISSRICDLARAGKVKCASKRRKSSQGKPCQVWTLPAEGEVVSPAPGRVQKSRYVNVKVLEDPKNFWMDIRSRVLAYVTNNGEHVEDLMIQDHCRDFESDLRDVIRSFMQRIKNSKAAAFSNINITRRQLLDACAALNMTPPAVGKLVDMSIAKRNKRQIARNYHPDMLKNTVNNTTKDIFNEAIAAYELIEQYNAINRRNHNGV
jgi:hypothetical protein